MNVNRMVNKLERDIKKAKGQPIKLARLTKKCRSLQRKIKDGYSL